MTTAYLAHMPHAHRDEILTLLRGLEAKFASGKKGYARFQEPLAALGHFRTAATDFTGNVVVIGVEQERTQAERRRIDAALRTFMPWRKGPFRVFGIDIDAEWQSNRKWDRILPHLPNLAGKVIADIGCNNGYYMFRMVPFKPKLVLGFEPYLQHYYAFRALNAMAGEEHLQIEPLGVEHIRLFPRTFDVVFCLGILYHRPSPFEVLRDIREAMTPGGALIVESQGIPGDESHALFPEGRYAKVPGTYFIPTASCLANWLIRVGFKNVTVFCSHPMTCTEQRRTDWMTFESYADFINPADPTKTIDGYPAPLRIFVKATA